jgi:ankyrin repeat protein
MRERIESLFRACEAGDLERVKAIIAEGNHDVDGGNYWQTDTDPQGWQRSPLFIAVVHAHLDVARWLLENGADVNQPTKYGDTPLTMILQPPLPGHWFEAVELLMSQGADPTIANDDGDTALALAQKVLPVWEKLAPLFADYAD